MCFYEQDDKPIRIVVVANGFLYGFLLLCCVASAIRFLVIARRKYYFNYLSHKCSVLIMLGSLTASNGLFAFICLSRIFLVHQATINDFTMYSGLIVDLPVIALLISYKPDDSIGRYNKFTSRYSRF